ncbi:MAG: TetR/AcrR family transcriptional regulator [Chloroflexi bacterium]|nr:MAG: TetR/AcrR family transcriptional regulator [Chloroflexota bacterium]MBL1193214.1 TetR/AcrR family transcriptional regulator [Chloroflexota bacterium]NOH10508.1 TetR/AcrR family transcriptional regulator [Chloroflexota bacterium]
MTAEPTTRLKIMELAQDLLRDKGYNGFSYKHIAEELDVKNAAIHYHFPSKEDLGVAVIARERRRFKKWIARQSIRELDVWGRLDWFMSIYEHYSNGGTRVCYLGVLESSFDAIPPELQNEARALNTEMLDWLTELLEEGRQQGEFQFESDAASKAVLVISVAQGSLQIARVTSSDSFFSAVQQVKRDLGFQS